MFSRRSWLHHKAPCVSAGGKSRNLFEAIEDCGRLLFNSAFAHFHGLITFLLSFPHAYTRGLMLSPVCTGSNCTGD
jgi:hypothetical protein